MKPDLSAVSRFMVNYPEARLGNTVNAQKGAEEHQEPELRKACEDFESLFINQLMKQMRKTIPKSDLFPESQAKEIYTSMMDSEMSSKIAKGGGLGLAELLMRQVEGTRSPKT